MIIIGLNHKTAPIEIREKFYLNPLQQDLLLSELKNHPLIDGEPTWMPKFSIDRNQYFQKETLSKISALGRCQQWKEQTVQLVVLSTAVGVKEKQMRWLEAIYRLQSVTPHSCQAEASAFWTSVHDLISLYDRNQRQQIQVWLDEAKP